MRLRNTNLQLAGRLLYIFNGVRASRSLFTSRCISILTARSGSKFQSRFTSRTLLSPCRYERLRQEAPGAISRVKTFEGNLLYEDLGLSAEDKVSLKGISVAFHAGGPYDAVLEYCQDLPELRSVAVASTIFKYRGKVAEILQNEKSPNLPIAMVRFPLIGPAYKEPMPGFVEVFKGSTALMVGAGYAYGDSSLQAEIIPTDIAVNTLIATAWEVGMYVYKI